MAAVAHAKSEVVYFTNDNPGTGFPDEIVADMISGGGCCLDHWIP
jgi:hypothetical protein